MEEHPASATPCLIDETSFIEIQRALSITHNPQVASPWAWVTARTVTPTLIFSGENLIPIGCAGVSERTGFQRVDTSERSHNPKVGMTTVADPR